MGAATVHPDAKIILEYTLSTEDEIVDSTEGLGPLSLELGKGTLHPAIEKALLGLEEGRDFSIVLDPSLAFGEPDPSLRFTVAKRELPEAFQQLRMGDHFESPGPDGRMRRFRVVGQTPTQLIVDGNHPLAGQVLYLEGHVLKVQ